MHHVVEKSKLLLVLVLQVFFLNLTSIFAAHSETIRVWTYHTFPPFVVDEQKELGLSFDLANLLTTLSNGDYKFEVQVMNRTRVDGQLATGVPGIVFWVNSAWFNDEDKKKYLWSSALIRDSNAVISPQSNPVQYEGAESLTGLRLVGVRGHHFGPVDALVEQQKIIRKNIGSEKQAVQFIASERADVSIIPYTAAAYYVNSLGLADNIHFSDNPHSRYDRHILVHPKLQNLYEFIERSFSNRDGIAAWQAMLGEYGLRPE